MNYPPSPSAPFRFATLTSTERWEREEGNNITTNSVPKYQIYFRTRPNLVTMAIFSVAGVILLHLATACWATIDSVKIQNRGSQVLGIAFKPVVVFAVCAGFLWGLGFGWYLVLRHRVVTTPIDLADTHQTSSV